MISPDWMNAMNLVIHQGLPVVLAALSLRTGYELLPAAWRGRAAWPVARMMTRRARKAET